MSGERFSPDDEVVPTESRWGSRASSTESWLEEIETTVALESRLQWEMLKETDIPSSVARGGMLVIWNREGGGSFPNTWIASNGGADGRSTKA
ncbi:hypothetical protein NUW54_g14355 [Trametes sanguinea]|uniref:Uncharacterized protein n=1 Tax=Trametes sanguinea TaxID=158606 RepID=A0ACC1MEN7_9APHY|nr:hypothetical protein NUW54_g14355 [Trametes sanguinea]